MSKQSYVLEKTAVAVVVLLLLQCVCHNNYGFTLFAGMLFLGDIHYVTIFIYGLEVAFIM